MSETNTQTSPVSGITTEVAPNGQAHIPGTQAVTVAPKPAIDTEACLKRFDETFKLEGEVVGSVIKRKVSTKGAIRVTLDSKRDIGKALNMKGDALDQKMRELGMGLKTQIGAGVNRLLGNASWIGHAITQNAAGNVVTFQLKKVEPLAITAPKVTDEDIAAQLGLTVEQVKAMREAKAKADAETAELAKMEAEEKAKLEAAEAAKAAEAAAAAPAEEATAQE